MSQNESWWEEKRSAYLYHVMAEKENNPSYKKLFLDLANAADKQAVLWEKKIGAPAPQFQPDTRTKIVKVLINLFGTKSINTILSAMKIRGMSIYGHEFEEHKHTTLNSTSNLRAAIFGINDGLVSNMSLLLGLAGAQSNQHTIVIAGIAGLLAGACSMGAGEYISVRSQREVFEYQIAIEQAELAEYPEEEMQELALIYQARGIPEPEANQLAKIMISNPKTGLDTLAREELGINPGDLISPIGAMIFSFLSFSVGAFIPVVPFLVSASPNNLMHSMILTGLSLFVVGATLSLYTNRNMFISGLRMLLIGTIAGAVTYLIGSLFGVQA